MEATIDASQVADLPHPAKTRTVYPMETWLKARKAYVTGKGSIPEICKMFGLTYSATKQRAQDEKWLDLRQRHYETLANAITPVIPQTAPAPIQEPITPTTGRLATVERQLDRINELLDNAADGDEFDKLTRSKQRLFAEWQVLSGTPNPGSRRPARISSKRQNAQPIAPVEAPAPTEPQG